MSRIMKRWLECAVNAIQIKWEKMWLSLHVGEVTVITDYFVLASGSNKTQLDAMVDGVEEAMKDSGYTLKQREGKSIGGWILLDYGDIVVHLFDSEMREFYDLDAYLERCEKKTLDRIDIHDV